MSGELLPNGVLCPGIHHGYILTEVDRFLTMKQVKYQTRYQSRDEFDQFTLHLEDDGQTIVRKKEPKKVDETGFWYYVGFAGDLGFTIAVPCAGGAFLGMWIDKQLSSYPTMTLSLLFLGIVLSFVGFIRIVKDLMKRKS